MAVAEWRIAVAEWRMAVAEWRMAVAEWRMAAAEGSEATWVAVWVAVADNGCVCKPRAILVTCLV